MHDPLPMSRRQTLRNARRQIQKAPRRKRTPGKGPCQGGSLHQLRNDVGSPSFLADVVDGDDVRVRERRARLRFGLKPPEAHGVAGRFPRQDLQCHLTRETRVPRAIDFPHPTRPEKVENLVASEPPPARETPRVGRLRLPPQEPPPPPFPLFLG